MSEFPNGTTRSSRWPATSPFGDYFKEGAIRHAWDLLTGSLDDGGYGLDPDRLWVTVYETDNDAAELWQKVAGVAPERIQRMGMADNFWSMGVPGPCGPCSEIYYDRGPEFGVEGGPVADENRYLEIWNLVFMQDMRGDGTGKGDFPDPGPTAEAEHRHRPRRRAAGVPAAGRRQRLRDRPSRGPSSAGWSRCPVSNTAPSMPPTCECGSSPTTAGRR